MAHSLGQASLAVPVAPSPVAGVIFALFGECSLVSFLLGCAEDPTPYFPTWTYWFGGSTPFLEKGFACSDINCTLTHFTQTFLH